MRIIKWFAWVICAAASLAAAPAFAQATRTWVSGVGDDLNPCSRTAPCKTFAGAISKTATGGEISVLDPAGFGAVTITKAISIVSVGSEGSILAAGVNGIIVNAPANAKVHLYGLMIEGASTGLNGIRVLSGDVRVENVVIRGFTQNGIDMQATTPSRLFVKSSSISHNAGGVNVLQSGANSSGVILEDVSIDRNTSFGFRLNGALMTGFVSESTLTGNTTDIQTLGGATLTSFGNNTILVGSPTSTTPVK